MPRRPTARLQLNRLEDRTTPITPIYVNDAWLGLAPGTYIQDADPIQPGDQEAGYGATAFYTLTSAFSAFSPDDKVVSSFGGFSSGPPATATAGTVYLPGGAGGIEWARHTSGITFDPTAVFAVDLNGPEVGTGYDNLWVFGTANIDGAFLRVDTGYIPEVGESFTILTAAGGLVGTFAGLPDGATVTAVGGSQFTIRYTATEVVLERVQDVPPGPPQPPPELPLPLTPPPVPAIPPALPAPTLATGAAAGHAPEVVVYDQNGNEVKRFLAYHEGFLGGVNVAVADVTGDGVADVVTAAGPGGGPHVKVFDGVTFEEVRSFYAYDPSFAGGVSVAAADVTGDGVAEIVTGAGPGGGPHVKVFDADTLREVRSFYAYDEGFRGGVNVAVSPTVQGFSAPEPLTGRIITGAGPGAGPHVKVFDADTLAETQSFYAFDPAFGGGVNVATNSGAPIITGAGAGGGPHVKVFYSSETGQLRETEVFAGPDTETGGVRVGFDPAAGRVLSLSRSADGGTLRRHTLTSRTLDGLWTATLGEGTPDAGGFGNVGSISGVVYPLYPSPPLPDDSFL